MISRIEVSSIVTDSRAQVLRKSLQNLNISQVINDIKIIDVYTIEKNLSQEQLKQIAQMLFNPVTQTFLVIASEAKQSSPESNTTEITSSQSPRNDESFDWTIEYGFLPGVTDNVANTAKESIEDLLKVKFENNDGVYSSKLILITGKLTKKDIEVISENLINPLVQRINFKTGKEFIRSVGMEFVVPKVSLEKIKEQNLITEVDLKVDDEKLINIGKFGIPNDDGTSRGPLALTAEYMKVIQNYFQKLGRNPTDIELESIAQTWSEHCKHTIFSDAIDDVKEGLFNAYIKKATEIIRKKKGKKDICVSVFTDNSGAIEFDNKYLITHKVETHNSPSALDPFGGAITGIVGVNRDAIGFGMGAKPVANTYGFCFANPFDEKFLYKDSKLKIRMLPPRRIMDGVIAGVNSGGNTSGIPTPQGFVMFDESYKGKPLVFVGTVGLIPKKIAGKPSWEKKAQPGDLIVMVGGRVGLDGIHGATFSSVVLDSGSPATAIQIGDPITQKKLSDAIVKEARDLNLYTSITDNGAGGLSCSVAEMAKESGGAEVDLDKVPTKYPGLKPWQIWISESQERMTLAVAKNKWKKFESLMKKRGVEATVIGKFTKSGKCIVKVNGQKIMNLDMQFLHDGLPKRNLVTEEIILQGKEPEINLPKNPTKDFLQFLQSFNITGTEYISSQYDHEVQASSVVKPLQGKGRINADYSIIKPVLNSKKGIVLSQGLYPSYSQIDPYYMALSCIDTAVRNVIVAGANPEKIAILDNFCWCSSNDPKRLWQLKRSLQGCFDGAVEHGTPFISGKDSMFNDFSGFDEHKNPVKISVLPTLLISSIALIDDVKNAVSIDAKNHGDLIYILGDTYDELGGSEYYNFRSTKSRKLIGNNIPKVDLSKNKKLYNIYYKAVQKDLISSAIGVGRGGLIVALVKTLLGGMLGANISLKNLPGKVSRSDFGLYSESQGRIVLTIDAKNQKTFERNFRNIPFAKIGEIKNDQSLIVKGIEGEEFIKSDIESMMKSYKNTFKDF